MCVSLVAPAWGSELINMCAGNSFFLSLGCEIQFQNKYLFLQSRSPSRASMCRWKGARRNKFFTCHCHKTTLPLLALSLSQHPSCSPSAFCVRSQTVQVRRNNCTMSALGTHAPLNKWPLLFYSKLTPSTTRFLWEKWLFPPSGTRSS